MDFRELVEKYKNGKASEEEIKLIKEEIDKNRIINEFLMEEIDYESFKTSEEIKDEKYTNESKGNSIFNKDFSRRINKNISLRIYKSIFKCICGILACLLIWNFILYPILNRIYYNPNRKFYNAEKFSKNIEDDYQYIVDMRILDELFSPIDVSTYVRAENIGIGKYEIKMHRKNIFNGRERYVEFLLDKNKINLDSFQYVGENLGTLDYINFNSEEKNFKDLNELKDEYIALAYVNLKDDLSIEEAEKLIYKYNLSTNYLKVKSGDYVGNIPIGFNPNSFYGMYMLDYVDMEIYPEIFMLDLEANQYERKETHFKSLLKYAISRPEIIESFYWNFNMNLNSQYRYVEENGVNIEGFLVEGKISDLKKLFEDEKIKGFVIDEVRFSKYQK